MLSVLKLAFALAVLLAVGDTLLGLLEGEDRDSRGVERWALRFGFGVGGIGTLSLILGVLGLPFEVTVLLPILLLIVAIPAGWRWHRDKRPPWAHLRLGTGTVASLTPLPAALLVFILFNVGLVGFGALMTPLHEWDAVGVWGLKAKVLFYEGTLYTDTFFDPDRLHLRPRHPLLISFVEAYLWGILGEVDDRLVKALFVLTFVAILGLAYGAQRRWNGRTGALAGTALLAGLPALTSFPRGLTSGYVDGPLALFYLGNVVFLARWLRGGKRRDLGIAAVWMAFAMLTKDEGLGLMVVSVTVAASFGSWVGPPRQRLRELLGYVVRASALVTPWVWLRFQLPIKSDENYLGQLGWESVMARLERVPTILAHFGQELVALRLWGLFWLVVGVVLVVSWRRLREPVTAMLVVALGLHAALYGFAFLLSPWEVTVQLNRDLTRLFIHMAPVAVLLLSRLLPRGTRPHVASFSEGRI